MIGLRGSLGDVNVSFDTEWYTDDHSTDQYKHKDVFVVKDFHGVVDEPQPAISHESDVLLWIWGEIYGIQTDGGYISRHSCKRSYTDAEYCAYLFNRYGLDFIERLNSEFAGVIFNRSTETVYLYTDRLGSRPVYYYSEENKLIFSTNIVDLYNCTAVDCSYSLTGLYQYLLYERCVGIETPIDEINMIPPGSILKFDLQDRTTQVETYWRPEYDPDNRSYDKFVKELTQIYYNVVEERTNDHLSKGLLLSGGSDSRLITSYFDGFSKAYHMNESKNDEYQIARKVANTVDIDFVFLQRDAEYYGRVLQNYGHLINFSGWFDQAHVTGFKSILQNEIDVIFSGQYSDTIFGHYIPQRNISIPLLNKEAQIPVKRPIKTIDSYVDLFSEKQGRLTRDGRQPSYVKPLKKSPISFEIRNGEPKIGGVQYNSILDLLVSGMFYPITNARTYPFYESLLQFTPVRMPFLDNRLVDIALQMPMKYLLRKDIAKSVLNKIDSRLSSISHAESGFPLVHPSTVHTLGVKWTRLKRELNDNNINAGPWSNHEQLIREEDFLENSIKKNEDIISNMPIFDSEEANMCYKRHLEGENRTYDLYPLASFLAIQSEYHFPIDF